MHLVAAEHEMPESSAKLLSLGLGTLSMVQLIPSQDSASGTSVPAPLEENPTAMHEFDVRHEIPDSRVFVAREGFATVSMVHTLPSHASARATVVPALSENPTAVQELALLQATLESSVSVALVGLGMFSSF